MKKCVEISMYPAMLMKHNGKEHGNFHVSRIANIWQGTWKLSISDLAQHKNKWVQVLLMEISMYASHANMWQGTWKFLTVPMQKQIMLKRYMEPAFHVRLQ